MGWPPKFGVVGRASSLQAKGRRLDSPRARLKLGPDFQRVALLETEPRFPALRRGNWGPIARKIVESCGVPSNFSMRDTFLLGREIFRANIIGKVDWSLSMQLTFCNKKAGMAFYSLSHHCSRIFTSQNEITLLLKPWKKTGLPNAPKTKMINGIMLVVLPQPFLQVSLWRCKLKRIDWLVVPGVGSEPPKCRQLQATGILRARIWKG